jgi:hypothetical protein
MRDAGHPEEERSAGRMADDRRARPGAERMAESGEGASGV